MGEFRALRSAPQGVATPTFGQKHSRLEQKALLFTRYSLFFPLSQSLHHPQGALLLQPFLEKGRQKLLILGAVLTL
jgi:hypothetical protein